jgi:hypothetical protein
MILLLCIQDCKNFFFTFAPFSYFSKKYAKNQKEEKTGNEKYATMGIDRS